MLYNHNILNNIKNMFGRKKNKKQKNIYTGSYVVKDADNIISIAQSYGISWKELAKVNDIDPPYILISGETISVPGEKNENIDEQETSQISDIQSPEYAKEQAVHQNTQIQQSNNSTVNNMKVNTSKTQSTEKSAQQKDVSLSNKKKVRKVTYASPKNMLHKPSAEPTTQSIDIEWMKDDEAAYSEEIQLQRKKTNIRFIVISILIIILVGFVIWRGTTWFLKQKNNKNVSVQTLIEKNEDTQKDEVKKDISNDKNEEDEELAMKGGEDLSQEKNDKEKNQQNEKDVSVEEITIQVLNAGAQTGAASDVTKVFANSGYKTSAARNAKNDYKGVVIYYSSDKKDDVDIIAKEVPQKYGTQKYEESDEVTKKYGTDFVVVLGS